METGAENRRNLILSALPEQERQVFRDRGQSIQVHVGKTLQGSGLGNGSVFFPSGAVLSLIGLTEQGLSLEIGLIGCEGMVGISHFLGSSIQPLQCIVQLSGEVCLMPVSVIREARMTSLQAILLRYANIRMIELAQSAVCNRFHLARQRLCRWLLSAHDRADADDLEFTQEMLAAMIGARRPVVTMLIGAMQAEGILAYRRGCLSILKRAQLEQCGCECYGIMANAMAKFVESLTQQRTMTSK
jgi:CRP-like cAMP-binding protein